MDCKWKTMEGLAKFRVASNLWMFWYFQFQFWFNFDHHIKVNEIIDLEKNGYSNLIQNTFWIGADKQVIYNISAFLKV